MKELAAFTQKLREKVEKEHSELRQKHPTAPALSRAIDYEDLDKLFIYIELLKTRITTLESVMEYYRP